MRLVETLKANLQAKAAPVLGAYRKLLAKAAAGGGELGAADGAKLADCVADLRLSPDDVQADLEAVARFARARATAADAGGVRGRLDKAERERMALAVELDGHMARIRPRIAALEDEARELRAMLAGVDAAAAELGALRAENPRALGAE